MYCELGEHLKSYLETPRYSKLQWQGDTLKENSDSESGGLLVV